MEAAKIRNSLIARDIVIADNWNVVNDLRLGDLGNQIKIKYDEAQ
jgi:hypothetical protein